MAIQAITPQELKDRLAAGDDIVVIDVRMPHELEIANVDFTTHIVLDDLPERINEVPKDKTVVYMCRGGGRSMQAAQFTVAQGWDESKILNLQGGILRWAKDIDPSIPSY